MCALVKELADEIRMMELLRGARNIVRIDEYKVLKAADRLQFTICIRMELLTPLGIVLYRLLNQNRLPFLDTHKQLLFPAERKSAIERRLRGENLSVPCAASAVAAEVILKACAYNPDDRYCTAAEMKAALQRVRGVTVDSEGNAAFAKNKLARWIGIAAASLAVVLLLIGARFLIGAPDVPTVPDVTDASDMPGSMDTLDTIDTIDTLDVPETTAAPETTETPPAVVTEARWLTELSVRQLPDKVEYSLGGTLLPSGLVLDALYSDGTVESVRTGIKCSPGTLDTPGVCEIIAEYGGMKTSFTVTVKFTSLISEGVCGDSLIWQLSEDGRLHISGTGAMEEWSNSENVPWASVRGSIRTVEVGEGVSNISAHTFTGCESLTEVILPESVLYVEIPAFAYCPSLTAIRVSADNTAYVDEDGVQFNKSKTTLVQYPAGRIDTSYTVPDGVKTIGASVFFRCGCLTSVKLPWDLRRIEIAAFQRCEALTEVELPDGLTEMGSSAFYGCHTLTEVTIPAGVRVIDLKMFYDCKNLKKVVLENPQTTFSSSGEVFKNTHPDFTLYGYANSSAQIYAEQNGHRFIALDGLVNTCGKEGSSLTYELSAGGTLTIRGTGEMEDWFNSAPWNSERSMIQRVVIEEGVTYIGDYAFSNCVNLTEITIPSTMQRIADSTGRRGKYRV